MKKNIFLITIITISLLIVGCGNKQKIEWNVPQDYMLIKITGYPNGDITGMDINKTDTVYYKSITGEKAYLKAYNSLCRDILFNSCILLNYGADLKSQPLHLGMKYKLIDRNNIDIMPLINFPYKEVQEDIEWKEYFELFKTQTTGIAGNCDVSQVQQPRFKETAK